MALPIKVGYDENGNVSFIRLVNSAGADRVFGASNADNLTVTALAALEETLGIQIGFNGTGYDRQRFSDGKARKAQVAMAGVAGTLNIWTPAAAKKFRLQWIVISTDVNATFTLKDAASGQIVTLALTANQPYSMQFEINGYLSLAANNILQIDYPAVTGNLYVTAMGNEE